MTATGSLAAFVLLGNLVIVLAWQFTARSVDLEAPKVDGVSNLVAVDGHLWRSAAPSASFRRTSSSIPPRTSPCRPSQGAPA